MDHGWYDDHEAHSLILGGVGRVRAIWINRLAKLVAHSDLAAAFGALYANVRHSMLQYRHPSFPDRKANCECENCNPDFRLV